MVLTFRFVGYHFASISLSLSALTSLGAKLINKSHFNFSRFENRHFFFGRWVLLSLLFVYFGDVWHRALNASFATVMTHVAICAASSDNLHNHHRRSELCAGTNHDEIVVSILSVVVCMCVSVLVWTRANANISAEFGVELCENPLDFEISQQSSNVHRNEEITKSARPSDQREQCVLSFLWFRGSSISLSFVVRLFHFGQLHLAFDCHAKSLHTCYCALV